MSMIMNNKKLFRYLQVQTYTGIIQYTSGVYWEYGENAASMRCVMTWNNVCVLCHIYDQSGIIRYFLLTILTVLVVELVVWSHYLSIMIYCMHVVPVQCNTIAGVIQSGIGGTRVPYYTIPYHTWYCIHYSSYISSYICSLIDDFLFKRFFQNGEGREKGSVNEKD